jgi:hypothetical protein
VWVCVVSDGGSRQVLVMVVHGRFCKMSLRLF